MGVLTALKLWAFAAAATATNGVFPIPDDVPPRYQEPWAAVCIEQDVYLFRVSNGSWTSKNGLCVRSRALRTSRSSKTALRTLDLYSGNDGSTEQNLGESTTNGMQSVNISVDASKKDVIDVNVTSELKHFIDMNLPGVDENDPCVGQYHFSVLFADNRCLLLETRPSVYYDTPTLSSHRFCSLWVPKFNLREQIKCCLFMFHILCGPGVQVYQNSCIQKG